MTETPQVEAEPWRLIRCADVQWQSVPGIGLRVAAVLRCW